MLWPEIKKIKWTISPSFKNFKVNTSVLDLSSKIMRGKGWLDTCNEKDKVDYKKAIKRYELYLASRKISEEG